MAAIRRFWTLLLRALVGIVLALLLAVGGFLSLLLLPEPDSRGMEELSIVEIGPIRFEETSLEDAVAELNEMIAATGKTDARIGIGAELAEWERQQGYPIALSLEPLPAAEAARYLGDLTSGLPQSTTNGLVLDVFHADHRSLRGRIQDWWKHDLPIILRKARRKLMPDPYGREG